MVFGTCKTLLGQRHQLVDPDVGVLPQTNKFDTTDQCAKRVVGGVRDAAHKKFATRGVDFVESLRDRCIGTHETRGRLDGLQPTA
ncbi:MAG: hypothetical protein EBU67_04980 [Actinobacteria bacterium]|nr:hypothetical protein [Actinomycetota bacterium]NBP53637.1 hypothetical protein [Actinomycetota bacterium]